MKNERKSQRHGKYSGLTHTHRSERNIFYAEHIFQGVAERTEEMRKGSKLNELRRRFWMTEIRSWLRGSCALRFCSYQYIQQLASFANSVSESFISQIEQSTNELNRSMIKTQSHSAVWFFGGLLTLSLKTFLFFASVLLVIYFGSHYDDYETF